MVEKKILVDWGPVLVMAQEEIFQLREEKKQLTEKNENLRAALKRIVRIVDTIQTWRPYPQAERLHDIAGVAEKVLEEGDNVDMSP